MRYASQLVGVEEDGGRAAIHRVREIVGPGERYESEDVVVRLDRVSAHEVAAEGRRAGFLGEPDRSVPQTEAYLGSTVVVLRAPRTGERPSSAVDHVRVGPPVPEAPAVVRGHHRDPGEDVEVLDER